MERFLLVTVIVCCCCLRQSTGLDFTLDRDVGQDFDGGAVCGVLSCVEESHTDTNISTSADQSETGTSPDDVSTISSLTIYRTDGPQCTSNTEHKQKTVMAAVTSQQRDILDVTSEDITVDGYLNAGHAELRLVMVKQEDCQAEFTCQVRAVDIQGRQVVKTSNLIYQPRLEPMPADASKILTLIKQMDSNLSTVGQSVIQAGKGLKNLQQKLGQSEDTIGQVENSIEHLENSLDKLSKDIAVGINSTKQSPENQTEAFDEVQPGVNNTQIVTMIKSLESKILEIDDIAKKTSNQINKRSSQCQVIAQNDRNKISGMVDRISNKSEHEIQTSFKNFSKDFTFDMDSYLNLVQGNLERDIREVFLSSSISSENIKLLQKDTDSDKSPTDNVCFEPEPVQTNLPVLSSCYKGMGSVLAQTSKTDAVIHPNVGDVLESPYLCDTHTDGGGWIIIQRRINGDVHFNRNWASYKKGFGSINDDFWLGNDIIHKITSSGTYELRVEIQYMGRPGVAYYNPFTVGDEASNYILHVGAYHGTTGNALVNHNGMEFSTLDRDNDASTTNCAVQYSGGWWYNNCFYANLNGKWGAKTSKRPSWILFTGNGLTFTEMKVRRVD